MAIFRFTEKDFIALSSRQIFDCSISKSVFSLRIPGASTWLRLPLFQIYEGKVPREDKMNFTRKLAHTCRNIHYSGVEDYTTFNNNFDNMKSSKVKPLEAFMKSSIGKGLTIVKSFTVILHRMFSRRRAITRLPLFL
uniref:Uncharacterized protein n=1 Tax=Oryza glumipatula TaxID=40148 RepID=A0A0D9Y5S4_9ORYZ